MPSDKDHLLSVILPAHDESGYIGTCLDSLVSQDAQAGPVEVVVVANGCKDSTVAVAREREQAFAARGWRLVVLDLPDGNKVGALNAGDAEATGDWRLYLDADIRCEPSLFGQLRTVLQQPRAIFVTGALRLAPARSWLTQRYGDFWIRLPFVRHGAVGAGLYAVNAEGRARWGQFPSVIADDGFARLQFRPDERIEVPAAYFWPLSEGFAALVRVRRRQDTGTAELFRLYPELARNEGKPSLGMAGLVRLALQAPVSFLVYAAVTLAVRGRRDGAGWARGR